MFSLELFEELIERIANEKQIAVEYMQDELKKHLHGLGFKKDLISHYLGQGTRNLPPDWVPYIIQWLTPHASRNLNPDEYALDLTIARVHPDNCEHFDAYYAAIQDAFQDNPGVVDDKESMRQSLRAGFSDTVSARVVGLAAMAKGSIVTAALFDKHVEASAALFGYLVAGPAMGGYLGALTKVVSLFARKLNDIFDEHTDEACSVLVGELEPVNIVALQHFVQEHTHVDKAGHLTAVPCGLKAKGKNCSFCDRGEYPRAYEMAGEPVDILEHVTRAKRWLLFSRAGLIPLACDGDWLTWLQPKLPGDGIVGQWGNGDEEKLWMGVKPIGTIAHVGVSEKEILEDIKKAYCHGYDSALNSVNRVAHHKYINDLWNAQKLTYLKAELSRNQAKQLKECLSKLMRANKKIYKLLRIGRIRNIPLASK